MSNIQNIKTNIGNYQFEKQTFAIGGKLIDKTIAKENLLLFKEILEKNNVQFSLAYGTLLGVIRENDFITHDEDIDVAILKENEQDFLNTLFELKEKGFIVGRYGEDLLSVIREGEYIDIYIFRKASFGYRKFANEVLKEHFLTDITKYEFLSTNFDVPTQYIKYLELHYGKDWKIPKKNTHACNPGLYLSIKLFLKNNFTIVFNILSFLKKKITSN